MSVCRSDQGSDAIAMRDGLHLVTAVTAWCDAVDRGMVMPTDHLVLRAAGDARVSKLLVANPYRSAPILAVRRLLGQGEPPLPPGPGARVQLTPVRLRRRDPMRLPAVQAAARAYDRRLARAARALGMHDPAVIVSDPLVAGFASFSWAGTVTYLAWDDWAAHPGHRPWWPAYRAAYQAIAERGHRVAAVSRVLLERLQPSGRSEVIPNGIDACAWREPAAPPAWFAELPAPRMVYVGTLDHRLDVDIVTELAARFAAGSIVLVGTLVDRERLAPLAALPNVHVVAPVDRSTVVSLVHAADVGLMPHRRDPLTEAMCPLKLYEYLAGGRPAVATDLPPVRSIDARILVADGPSAFSDAVADALGRGPLPEAERQAFLDANDWSARIDKLLALAAAPDRLIRSS